VPPAVGPAILETVSTASATPSDLVRTPRDEERFVIHDVPWHVYVSLRDSLDARGSKLRITYLKGELELTSPSPEHVERKSLIARLVEAWCLDRGIELFFQGRTTFRDERAERGIEPDESYSFGTRKAVPDLAIEVVHSGWRVDKLDVYRGLGIEEVWVVREGRVQVHRLAADGYEHVARSAVLPDLDLALLAQHAVPGTSLTSAVRAFRAATGT
jgi:Uma2 family endonuclease